MSSPAEDRTAGSTLPLSAPTLLARGLGLRRGDTLVGLGGKPLPRDPAKARAMVRQATTAPRLATFRRGAEYWSVMCDTSCLGRWSATPVPGSVPADLPDPFGARNWEIMVHRDGLYDVQPQGPTLMGILVPFHLVNARLWPVLALWTGLSLLCVFAGWAIGTALWVLICFYFWRAGPTFVRSDRQARGFGPWRVMAARGERALHAEMARVAPHLRNIHAPAPQAEVAENAGDRPATSA